MLTKRDLLRFGAAGALASATPGAAFAQSRAGLFGAIDIAQKGFAYGLPIVMNYAVMYKFVIDKNSGQYKAPFNEISNEAASLHLQGHRRRHPQQRHALFDAVDGPAGRADRHQRARRSIPSATTRSS